MEQRLSTQYLSPGLVERASAIAIAALGLGAGILVASWGISRIWQPPLNEISLRIANPEVHLAGKPQVTVTQDKPFELAQSGGRKSHSPGSDPERRLQEFSKGGNRSVTAKGEVIRHEVTLFATINHERGQVTTGWVYRDGSGGVPSRQYCYYSVPNVDQTSTKVDLAQNGMRLPNIIASRVPGLENALGKCQWWRG